MTIVDRLKQLAELGAVISCSEMTLLAGDHDPPVVVGEGEIAVSTSTTFRYSLRGIPEDLGHAMRSLTRIHTDPYDDRLRERLTVTTAEGLSLMAGWTIPNVHIPDTDGPWHFTGEVDALSFLEDGHFEAGTEVAYLLPRQHRARVVLRRFFPEPTNRVLPEVRLSILGSEVVFTLDDDADLLLAWAPATDILPPTLTENWLGEPLRILFGQLIYPRFVSRRSKDRSMAWVRPSPAWSSNSDACALWQGDGEFIHRDGFWETYRRLLAYVASARGADGHANFEANKVTDLYGEIIQASHGSRWVWALTYASAVEGMLKLLGLEGTVRNDLTSDGLAKLKREVDEFKAHVDRWSGDPQLKQPAKDAAARVLRSSAKRSLRQLVQEGWITKDQLGAWTTLRNRVMHGSLVSPYSSAEEDKLLLDLAKLFHALTRRLLANVSPDTSATP